MLSGNGRHRRPRQAPALVVAAGVTGSAIAIPLLAATSASAASTTTWDKLAECESGGQWSLDAGNGYYGGLQFSQEVWDRYGGLEFAPTAAEASRSQQIAVGEKALAAKGPGVWPSCSIVAGLTQSGEAAEVDPGVSVSPQPSESADSSDSSDSSGTSDSSGSGEKNHEESGTSGSSDEGDEAEASDTPSADASTDTSGNKADDDARDDAGDDAKGASADKSADADSDGDGKSGQSDSTSSADPASSASGDSAGRHRGDRAADDTAASRGGEGRHASREDREEESAEGTYTVRSGDNLWDIADAQGVNGGWDALYDLNKKTVGTDPDLILPGQSLDLGLESVEK
ncbi:transglycosylase family protein [Streptomyces kunmingensis]|uniref:Transglycosylase family protein n=1 Tax=Streptomyces kunmingensis TaxID=68225 RepID=A0ABU6CKB4_9ACTN|nr:transglycosylase family protein [Streptomyces kunmingensis]MEB3964879.1 transglycosylase family protein [Streptomyces kunmingensis]